MFGEDEQSGRAPRNPSESLAGDSRRKADLLIMLPKGPLDRSDFRLDLGHQECVRPRFPRQQIDRTALPIHGIRHLGRNLPTLVGQQCRQVVAQPGVRGIEQTIQISSAPSNEQDEFRVETAQDLSERSDGHAIDPAALEQRDLALTHADSITQIALAPAESLSQVTPHAAELEVSTTLRVWPIALIDGLRLR